MPKNVSFEVYGGPGVTAQEIISLAASNNTFQKQHGVIKLGPIQTGISPDTITIIPSFQVDENGDPNNEPYLDMQSCNIIAPTIIGNYEDNYTYFGDNVFTNTNYFLQSGEIYANVQAGLYGQILEQDVEPRPFIYRIMEETHMTTQSHIMERVTMVTKNG
ncbi:MAG: hypothetical protein WCA62_04255 [Dehalococcoidales bacterium]